LEDKNINNFDIGFREVEYELDITGGWEFKKGFYVDGDELSVTLVTVWQPIRHYVSS
jgi:hypothetical protein